MQGSFKFDELAVPISGTLGVRYVDTETLSTGFNRVALPGTPVTFPRAARDGGYTKWLPSLNLRFDLTDDLVGRMTAGKVLARPNPSQLAFRRTLDGVGFTGSRGNPDLQPYEATQYDIGLEWYFSQDGFVSATAFRKEISSFIINTSTREELDGSPGDGSADDYTVTRPINGDEKVTINGIEAWRAICVRLPASAIQRLRRAGQRDVPEGRRLQGREHHYAAKFCRSPACRT